MSTVQIDYLVSIVQKTVSTLFSLDVRMIDQREEASPVAPFDVSAIIGMVGDQRGSLVMSFPIDLARALTARMIGESDSIRVSDPDISDCVGEISNIVAGNLLPLISDEGCGEKRLSLPSVVVGRHRIVWGTRDTPCDLVLFETELGQFVAETNLRQSDEFPGS